LVMSDSEAAQSRVIRISVEGIKRGSPIICTVSTNNLLEVVDHNGMYCQLAQIKGSFRLVCLSGALSPAEADKLVMESDQILLVY
jgi:hypothetical protein